MLFPEACGPINTVNFLIFTFAFSKIKNFSIDNVFSMGTKKQYRKFQCRTTEGVVYAVAFDTDIPGLYSVNPGDTVQICAEIMLNTWKGNSQVQLIIKRILFSED